MTNQQLFLAIRQAILMILDALERYAIANAWMKGPTTSEARKIAKGKL